MRPLVAASILLLSAGVARADQTLTLQASKLTVTLPDSDWSTTRIDTGPQPFDMITYLQPDHMLAVSVTPIRGGCSAWVAARTEARSKSAFWPSGMTVFQSMGNANITEKTCLQLVRGTFLFFVTHAPSIDDNDVQRILAVVDAVTYAGGGAGSEPAPTSGGGGGGTQQVAMPGTGLAISVPGGSAEWSVETKPGVASSIDYVVRKDISRPWFQISSFKFRSPASCASWERASRREGETYVASPAYSPRPFAFESRAKKDGHFVGTSCLPTNRGDYLVLFEYRGANDHDEDALAKTAIQSMLDSAGGARDAPSASSSGGGVSSSSGTLRARPKFARLRVLDAGYTQITPGDPTRLSGTGGTFGIDSIAVRAGRSALASAGEFESRVGYDSQAGWTFDARFGFGFGLRGPSVMLLAMAGIGFDAVGIGNEANPMTFKADGALYGFLSGQLLIVAGRSLGLSGTVLFASRAGEGNGNESRYGANLIIRRRSKSDVVLGVRFHDYDVAAGASAFTASLGLGY